MSPSLLARKDSGNDDFEPFESVCCNHYKQQEKYLQFLLVAVDNSMPLSENGCITVRQLNDPAPKFLKQWLSCPKRVPR